MRYYIETYDLYDWDYHVFAESENEAVEKLNAHWTKNDTPPKSIHKIHGPFDETEDVLKAKEPFL